MTNHLKQDGLNSNRVLLTGQQGGSAHLSWTQLIAQLGFLHLWPAGGITAFGCEAIYSWNDLTLPHVVAHLPQG